MIVKKGQIIVLTSGEYSDYHIDSVYVAKQDFDENAIYDEILKHFNVSSGLANAYLNIDETIEWLIEKNYIEKKQNYCDLWLGL